MDEYTAIVEISRTYSGVTFRTAADIHQGDTFTAPYVAIQVPGGWLKRPSFHVHEVRGGTLGQRVTVVSFEEARHVGA